MVDGGLQVLPEGHNVDVGRTQVIEGLLDLRFGLTQAQHQAGFGEHIGSVVLGMCQHGKRLFIAGARIAHGVSQATHGFHVLGKHLNAGVQYGLNVGQYTQKIGGQRLDRGIRVFRLHRPHAGCVVTGTAISKIVPIHGRQHHIAQAHQLHGARGIGGLLLINPAARIARVHCTKAAGAGADITHQHDSGSTGTPALAHVRALGLFAHGRQAMLVYDGLHTVVRCATAHANTQPVRFGQPCGTLRRRFYAILDRCDTPIIDELSAAGHRHQRYQFIICHVAVLSPGPARPGTA